MKTAIVRAWGMALGSLGYDDVSRKFGTDELTLAGIVISNPDAGEARTSKPVLPLGCVFAVRYSSR